MEKTNAMRILDQKKIKYEVLEYPHEDGVCVDAITVSMLLNQNPNQVFKTLVTKGNDNKYYVCVIPSVAELDLKKAAKAFRVKSLEMIHVKDLLSITGYIRGGCSPIGMKKQFQTIIDITALNYDQIMFSGGKIGIQIVMNPNDITKVINATFSDLRRE